MSSIFNIQLSRNSNVLNNKAQAINVLQQQTASLDGTPVVVRYYEGSDIKAVLGLAHRTGENNATFAYVELDNGKNYETLLTKLSTDTSALDTKITNLDTAYKAADEELDGKISTLDAAYKTADTALKNELKVLIDALQDAIDDINGESFSAADTTIVIGNAEDGGKTFKVNIDGVTLTTDANGKISVASSALTQYKGKEAIEVSEVDEDKNEKTISLKIDAANKVLSQSTNGLTATLTLDYDKTNKKVVLKGVGDAEVSSFDATDFIVDGMLDSVAYSTETGKENILVFTWNTDSKKTKTEIDLSKYIDTYTAGNGIEITNKTVSAKAKSGDKYIEVTADGIATKGIDEAIAKAVEDTQTEIIDAIDALDAEVVKNVTVNGKNATVESNEATVTLTADDVKVGTSANDKTINEKIAEVETSITTAVEALGDTSKLNIDAKQGLKKVTKSGSETKDKLAVNLGDAPLAFNATSGAIDWIKIIDGKFVIDCGTFEGVPTV